MSPLHSSVALRFRDFLPVTILSRAIPLRAPHWNRHVPLYELAFRTPGKTYIGTTQAEGLYRARPRSTCRHPLRICPGQVRGGCFVSKVGGKAKTSGKTMKVCFAGRNTRLVRKVFYRPVKRSR